MQDCKLMGGFAWVLALGAGLLSGTPFAAAATEPYTPAPDVAAARSDVADSKGMLSADLVLLARFSRSPVAAGSLVNLDGSIINEGPNAADNVSMRLALPAGLTLDKVTGSGPGGVDAECSGATLVVCTWPGSTDPGASLLLRASLTLDPAALPDTLFEVDVSVESNTPDPDPANNDVTATIRTVGLQSDITLDASLPDGVIAGAPFPVRLDVANVGPDPSFAAGALQLPPGVSFVSGDCDATLQGDNVAWETDTLAVGDTRRCTLTLTLASTVCTVTDIAVSVAGANHEPTPGNNVALLGNATTNLVEDPSFELNDGVTWDEESIVFPDDIICGPGCGDGGGTAGPNTGTLFVWFGGTTAAETAAVTQSLTIPTTARTLTFWNMLGVCSPAGELDQFRLLIDGVQQWSDDATSPRCDGPPYYVPVVIPLGSLANGAIHTLRFAYTKAELGITNFLLDDVGIGSAPACTLPPQVFEDGFED